MSEQENLDRRDFLKKSLLLCSGTAAAFSIEEGILMARASAAPEEGSSDGVSMPMGKIGKLEISRLICGGNLIGGWAHSGDLEYVSSLMQHYFTDEKIIETLALCESQGINTIVTVVDARTMDVLSKHWKTGGKIQWIAQLRSPTEDHTLEARQAIDQGAVAAFLHGGTADEWVADPKMIDKMRDIVAVLKKNNLMAGMAGHTVKTIATCEQEKLDVDFYCKTLNTVKYACDDHEEAIRLMKTIEKPWIGYKVLGAGRTSPTIGFKYAFNNGADFLCVGMFDFQVADDVAILKGLFARGIERERPWRG